MNGYTVVDFETTGFSHRKGDRVVEIGVVRLDEAGNIYDSWETLVNPMRHVGASHIHGISARDVIGAPTFEDIADLFARELSGSVFVAHNARFDADFAQGELTAARRLDGSQIPYLDTMSIARQCLKLPTFKLHDVCSALGITNDSAHSALSDAYATAEVLQAFIRSTDSTADPAWQAAIGASADFRGYSIHDPQCTRDRLRARHAVAAMQEALSHGEWMNEAIGHRHSPDSETAAQYFSLLDSVLLDRWLSQTEQIQLLRFAEEHQLSSSALRELHADYVQLLIQAAEADGIVTNHERNLIDSISHLLGVHTESLRSTPAPVKMRAPSSPRDLGSYAITLRPGDRVTVTGPVERTQLFWESFFAARGVQVAGIAKSTKVLIAGDPDSQSGKAKKARQYGIPIIGENAVDEVISF